MIDLPYYVENPPVIQQRAVVNRSNNWDLGRTSFATPIVPMAFVEPASAPVVSKWQAEWRGYDGVNLSKANWDLDLLDKHQKVVIDLYHPGTKEDARKYAQRLGQFLSKKGYPVSEVTFFTDSTEFIIKVRADDKGKNAYTPLK